MNFTEALEKSLARLREIEQVHVLSSSEKQYAGFSTEDAVLKVETEICDRNFDPLPIRLYLKFSEDFPLSIPTAYAGKKTYEAIKYIPHLDTNQLICTFDNKSYANSERPAEMAVEVLSRAKRIIEDGIQNENFSDFEEEFEAYWANQYSTKDSVLRVLTLFQARLDSDFKVIELEDFLLAGRKVVLHDNNSSALELKSFLHERNLKFKEFDGMCIGSLQCLKEPPFNMTNREVLKLLEKEKPEEVQKYEGFINRNAESSYVLFEKTINQEHKYFGWRHTNTDVRLKGSLRHVTKPFQSIMTVQANKTVMRLWPESYALKRLQNRTAGIEGALSPRYAFIGLGSIGSHLLPYLNDKHSVEFRLIDPDILALENIGRHLLGAKYVGHPKVEALRHHLKDLAPVQPITIRQSSVFKVVQDDPKYLNEADMIVVAIGEPTIEGWLVEKLAEGKITKPMLFLWVEPFLLGGHLIYLPPEDVKYSNLFDEEGSFIGNVINKKGYTSPVISKQEAGCQALYTPYSVHDIHWFLGCMLTKISDLIKNPSSEMVSYTFVGNKQIANAERIELSDHVRGIPAGTVIENHG
ncbi:E2/UBC family protein [Phaeocystidibacter marisrubri]|uniref:Uncharacterized protein n=1 Tax=Phaeocystidibacter marisrubri TaxID=1577780 RepID=A0A6L3ZDY1_9FLAO|nr:E2/UBC family protein [Phaeocystidibacter marisrubri]KAB2815602.1 hypothetical protein F8C82_07820 [Phaeocystidibacter marisrubri]GGH64737.1 hypothetical protein GCM10011318_01060 [Phaeocystidibacter marisrubri]